MSHSRCPSRDELAQFARGGAANLAGRIQEHVDSCSVCELALAGLRSPPSPVFEHADDTSASPSTLPPVGEVPEVKPAATPKSTPGTIGRYQVAGVLGDGGFGCVYLGHDSQLRRHVAIKVPHARHVATSEDAAPYLKEAQTLAKLKHARVVPVFDVGSTPEHPLFIVMEYIEGTNLDPLIKERRLSCEQAAELVATVAEALHYAHKQGLVHRDVKPTNILIDRQGIPYLADFGLALRDADYGKGARYAGTPAYMSPELAGGEGNRVDGRSDIFSLGIVLYELLCGRRPFAGPTHSDLLQQIIRQDPKPPRQIDDAIPEDLERICLKCLEKRPSDRYTTAKDLATDLRAPRVPNASALPSSIAPIPKRNLTATVKLPAVSCSVVIYLGIAFMMASLALLYSASDFYAYFFPKPGEQHESPLMPEPQAPTVQREAPEPPTPLVHQNQPAVDRSPDESLPPLDSFKPTMALPDPQAPLVQRDQSESPIVDSALLVELARALRTSEELKYLATSRKLASHQLKEESHQSVPDPDSLRRADMLIGHSVALMIQARLRTEADTRTRLEWLDQASAGAQQALLVNDSGKQYNASMALALALDDRAQLTTALPDFNAAINAYDMAHQIRRDASEPRIARARCLIRSARLGGASERIDEAIRELALISDAFPADRLIQSDVDHLTGNAFLSKGDLLQADKEFRQAWEHLKAKGQGEEPLRKTALLQDWGDCALKQARKLHFTTDTSTVAPWVGTAVFCADSLQGFDKVQANLMRARALGYQARVAMTGQRAMQEKALVLYDATAKLPNLSQKSEFELLFNRAELKRDLDKKDSATIKDYEDAIRVASTDDDRAAARGGAGLTRMDFGRILLRQGRKDESVVQFNESTTQLRTAINEAPSHPASNNWRLMLAARLLRGAPADIRTQRADEIRKLLRDGIDTSTEGMRNDFETLRQEFNKLFPTKRI